MTEEPLIHCEDGIPDHLGTCAYMVNFLQEYVDDADCFDELDRFRFVKSYQYRFDCATDNLVLQYLVTLVDQCPKLNTLRRKIVPNQIWPSHDIDQLFHTGWPILKTAIKNGRFSEIRQALVSFSTDPDRPIFENIININRRYATNATFFWLASQKIYHNKHHSTIANANYDIRAPKIRSLMEEIRTNNFELGVHQSLGCEDLGQERDLIGDFVSINRNHYLAGKLPQLWHQLEKTGISGDATAGFSEVIGFRNSYGIPIQPFDPLRNHAYSVMEYPLHIMDATLMKKYPDPADAFKEIDLFLKKNKTDCQLSILWHNNYFTDIKYPGWGKLYEEVLRKCFIGYGNQA